MAYDKNYWEQFAGVFEPKHYQDMASWIRYCKPERILEIGCGIGHRVFAANSLMVEAFGCDVSDYAISRAKKEYPAYKENYVKQDAADVPDNSADLVFTYDVLEHLPEKEIDAMIKNLIRVSNRWVINGITFGDNPNFPLDPTHITGKPKSWWKEKLESHGIKMHLTPSYFPYADQVMIGEKC